MSTKPWRIFHRRGSAEEWASKNPVLATAERGYQFPDEEFPHGRWKTGRENLNWNVLPYDDDPEVAFPTSTVTGRAVFTGDPTTGRQALGALGLVQAAKNPDLLVTGAITVDGNDLITSAAVVWPDGQPGTLTITSRDSNQAVLAYNITYGSPVTNTYTQPTITRNSNGAATNVPAIVVS